MTKFYEGCTKGFKVCSEVQINPKSLCYGVLNEIMAHPCSDGGLGSTRLGCTKFNEGCTKFCEWCTKGPKVRSKVGINPQSLPYGFLNEIMDHPCWNGGPGSTKIRCTKFNEGCTKGSKVRSEVGLGHQSLPFGLLNEIMDHPCWNGGPGSCRIGCTKFIEGCTKFCEGCSDPKWGSALNHFVMGF